MSHKRTGEHLEKNAPIPAPKVSQKLPHDMDRASFDGDFGVYLIELVAYCPDTDSLVRLTCDKEGRLLISKK